MDTKATATIPKIHESALNHESKHGIQDATERAGMNAVFQIALYRKEQRIKQK